MGKNTSWLVEARKRKWQEIFIGFDQQREREFGW